MWSARAMCVIRLVIGTLILARCAMPIEPCFALPSASTGIVMIADGPVRGLVTAGVREFLGIPYAAAPVGDLRWRPPQAPTRWSRPLQAVTYGNTCAQASTLGHFAAPSRTEDCLYLNVFAPANRSTHSQRDKNDPSSGRHRLLPVMVWIHGGALFCGESNDYDGSRLAGNGGVVVVSINYRLNVFGFLAHAALDSQAQPFANYGLMDQQFALQWVQRNIAAFGGDPANVTLFGESAGGQSVFAQLVSPSARGLFTRAITQSAAYAIELGTLSLSSAEARGERFATAVGCPNQTATCLRALSVEDIQSRGAAFSSDTAFTVDGRILTQFIREAIRTGRFNRVPVINGINRNEATWFESLAESAAGHEVPAADYADHLTAAYGAKKAPLIIAAYPLAEYGQASVALAAAKTSSIMACPADTVNRWLAHYVPTYAYEFADTTAPSPWPSGSFPLGAAHTLEIQYLFPSYHGATGTISSLSATQLRLSADMVSYWTRFAKFANPNSPATPYWPRFRTSGEAVMSLRLPRPAPTSDFAVEHRCALWNGLLDSDSASKNN